MDFIAEIEKRHSVRTFDPTALLSARLLSDLRKDISSLEPPWSCKRVSIGISEQLRSRVPQRLGKYGIVSGARYFLTIACEPDKATEIAAGFMAEQLVLRLTAHGVGTVWIGCVPSREAFAFGAGVDPSLTLAAIIPFGYATKPRLMERLMRTIASSSTRKPMEQLFFKSTPAGSIVPLTPDDVSDVESKILEAVRLAPSSLNSQPWRLVHQGNQWHVYDEFSGKHDIDDERMNNLDMGIALFHLAAAGNQLTGHKAAINFGSDIPEISVPTTWKYILSVDIPTVTGIEKVDRNATSK